MSGKNTITLNGFAAISISHSLPFAFYHLPGSKVIKILAQETSALHRINPAKDNSNKKGFLFAPFVESKKAFSVLIKPDRFLEVHLATLPSAIKTKSKKEAVEELENGPYFCYTNLVEKIKRKIVKEKFVKVVAARVNRQPKPAGFDACEFFGALCTQYPDSFVSMVYTPAFGLWIGASPEILLQHDDSTFRTYSLAGTMPNGKRKSKTVFGEKEKEEQQIVSDYMVVVIQKATKVKPIVTGPEVVEAGNLLHLRTTFAFSKPTMNKWQKIVQALHPSPAVAGIPKKRAIAFILKNEMEERSFYSGYLGPVNMDGQVNLYVNIRCLQVGKTELNLYVGCGITAGSDAKDEWQETEIKSQTLLDVLNNKG